MMNRKDFDTSQALESITNLSKKIGIDIKGIREYPERQLLICTPLSSIGKVVERNIIELRLSIFMIGDFIFFPLGVPNLIIKNLDSLNLLVPREIFSSNYVRPNSLDLGKIPYVSIPISQEDKDFSYISRELGLDFIGVEKRIIIFINESIGGIYRIMNIT